MNITDLIDQLVNDLNLDMLIKWHVSHGYQRGDIWCSLNKARYIITKYRLWHISAEPTTVELYKFITDGSSELDVQTLQKYDLTSTEQTKKFSDILGQLNQMITPLAIVVAMDPNQCIGKDGKLPWHYPEDLKWFKSLTINGTVIMGNNTYKSIGKPLPKRYNVVLSSNPIETQIDNLGYFDSLESAFQVIPCEAPCFIIGGETVYSLTLPIATDLYITRIRKEYDGDTFFPEVNWSEWKLISSRPGEHPDLTFEHYQRIIPGKVISSDLESESVI